MARLTVWGWKCRRGLVSIAAVTLQRGGGERGPQIYGSVWKPKSQRIMAVGPLIMSTVIPTSEVRCEENIDSRTSVGKKVRAQREAGSTFYFL